MARLAPSWCAVLAASVPAQTAYEFVVDGEPCAAPITPVAGKEGRPRPGDFAWIAGHEIVLGEPGTLRFERRDGGRLHRVAAETKTLVALEVRELADVADLGDADWRTLRSLVFADWRDEFESLLGRIDPARCMVGFGVSACLPSPAPLPAGLSYLDLRYSRLETLAGIERLKELRFLRVPADRSFDDHAPLLDLAPLVALRKLCRLEIDAARVADLSPLTGHPALRALAVARSPLARLPRRLPSLELFRSFSTGCPAAEIEEFRALHPATRVLATSREILLDAIAGTARLRIRTGSACHPRGDERQLFATGDAAEIATFAALLDTGNRYSSGVMIPGCGDRTFEFYDVAGRLLLALEVLGSSTLRSWELWGLQPMGLRAEARAPFLDWLRARGVVLRG